MTATNIRPSPTWKRGMDLALAGACLLSLLPVLLLLAACVRLTMGAPILFRQTRAGRGGRPFTLIKFRSMLEASPTDALSDSERLTRFGRFLRRSSLDELPELWNVLRGDMSLVGPRPLLMSYLPLYSAEQFRRHEVLPGLTGVAQIEGRNALTWEEKFGLDVWYVDNRSFLLDLHVLLRTPAAVLRRTGVDHGPSVTMPRFTGPRGS